MPIIRLTVVVTPKCTLSMPSAVMVGSAMGTITSSMSSVSRKQPSTRNSRLMISRKPKRETWSDWIQAPISLGICSAATT